MDQRKPPTGFHSYKATPSAQPSNQDGYRHSHGPPVPTAFAASPMTFGYNYNYNQSSTSASVWSSAQSTAVRQYAHLNAAAPNMPCLGSTSTTQQHQSQQQQIETWTCDACDVTVESERALKAHRKSHVKCTECSFEGAPKIVKAHYLASHGKFSGSGFKTVTVAVPGCRVQRFRVCVGNRPEDIQKWIADRKKRFPRQANAESNETNVASPTKDTTAKASKTTGLSSLLGGYGSSSDSEDETPDEREEEKKDDMQKSLVQETTTHLTEISTTKKPSTCTSPNARIPPSMGSRPCRYFMKNGKCLNGDACRFSHDLSNQPKRKHEDTRKRKRGKSSSNDTLLRKLLSNDVDREETLALQLLEHIFDSNFFDGAHESKKGPKLN
ncbi:unnamed protein product [Cylindrotheca closterium]|uniref:C3H1-type domain-containing protein n=1 Tax=Cylindrotheca closterium TaxID=2856 RepID=A0AAD2GC60_9STRA|nr:unnamed protein product [Cylindrotheca closterium]